MGKLSKLCYNFERNIWDILDMKTGYKKRGNET